RVGRIDKDEGFKIETTHGAMRCQSLVIATGGLSIPQIGATGFGYDVARQFGLSLIPTSPALDGFNFTIHDLKRVQDISGVSIDSIVQCNDASFRENILFTHTGLSGPASLQASLYWRKGDPISINLLPEVDPHDYLRRVKENGTKAEVKNILGDLLP